MSLFQMALLSAAFLCSLVAGFLLAFALVVMPGIRRMDDGDFIRTFQVIDRVIQNNQALFMLMWVGSVLAVLAVSGFGFWALGGTDRLLTIVAALVYLLGVQLPTVIVNVPLNNQLQRLQPDAMTDSARAQARVNFESPWNRWNVFRAVGASVASLLWMLLLVRV